MTTLLDIAKKYGIPEKRGTKFGDNPTVGETKIAVGFNQCNSQWIELLGGIRVSEEEIFKKLSVRIYLLEKEKTKTRKLFGEEEKRHKDDIEYLRTMQECYEDELLKAHKHEIQSYITLLNERDEEHKQALIDAEEKGYKRGLKENG